MWVSIADRSVFYWVNDVSVMKAYEHKTIVIVAAEGDISYLRSLLVGLRYSVLSYQLNAELDGRTLKVLADFALVLEPGDAALSRRVCDELLDQHVSFALITKFDHILEPRHECLHTLSGTISAPQIKSVLNHLEDQLN